MLWWIVGLWLLSPAVLPIVWLLGTVASSGRPRDAQARLPVVDS